MKKIKMLMAAVALCASVSFASPSYVPGALEVMTHNMFLGNDNSDIIGANIPIYSALMMRLYDTSNNLLYSEMSGPNAGFLAANQIYWAIYPQEIWNGKTLKMSIEYNGTEYFGDRTGTISWNSAMPDPTVSADIGQFAVPEPMTMILSMLGGLGLVALRRVRRK